MHVMGESSEALGWRGFGAFALGGEIPSARPLRPIELRMAELEGREDPAAASELAALRKTWRNEARRIFANLESWEVVQLARHPNRPTVRDYISGACTNFIELFGDRATGDDPAIVTGFAEIGGHRVMLVGHDRGRDLHSRVRCRFGCAQAEGYRKALSKMQLAAKFGVPIVTLVDTPGAYPGMESEARGIAQAIAANLRALSRLPVPIVSVVIGEGGSGGALAIGVGDRIAMLQHSVFSVISPEGCAAILWKTSQRAKDAADALRLRSSDLLEGGLIDEIIPEPLGGAHRDRAAAIESVATHIVRALDSLRGQSRGELLQQRALRLRTIGSGFGVA